MDRAWGHTHMWHCYVNTYYYNYHKLSREKTFEDCEYFTGRCGIPKILWRILLQVALKLQKFLPRKFSATQYIHMTITSIPLSSYRRWGWYSPSPLPGQGSGCAGTPAWTLPHQSYPACSHWPAPPLTTATTAQGKHHTSRCLGENLTEMEICRLNFNKYFRISLNGDKGLAAKFKGG